MRKPKAVAHIMRNDESLCGAYAPNPQVPLDPAKHNGCVVCMNEAVAVLQAYDDTKRDSVRELAQFAQSMNRSSEGLHREDWPERIIRAQGRYVHEAIMSILRHHYGDLP